MSKRLLSILVGGVVVVVIAAGVWWWLRPERVVNRSLQAVAASHSQEFQAMVEQAMGNEKGGVQLELNGVYTQAASARPGLRSDLMATIKTDGVTVELTGEVRLVNDKAYILLTKAPPLLPALTALKGKWLELPRGEAAAAATPPAGGWVATAKSAGREKIDGVQTNKYEVTLTQTALVSFMNSLAQLLGTQLTEQQVKDLQENLKKTDQLPVQFWIKPLMSEIRQVRLTVPTSNGANVTVTVKLGERNKPVTIEVPADAKPPAELLK